MKILAVLAFALTLLACGVDEPAPAEPLPEATPTVGKVIADDYQHAMEKAREVENQVMEQKQKIDAALKAAEDDT